MSFNSVTLVGRLGQDVELRYTSRGTAYARFSLATTETYTDQAGKKQVDTQWHSLICWAKQAEVASKYLSKGSRVLVEGKLIYNQWEKDGVKHTKAEVKVNKLVFLDDRRREKAGGAPEGDPEDIPF